MKLFVIATVLFFSTLNGVYADQISSEGKGEEWTATTTAYTNRCKSIGKDFPGKHSFVILVKSGGVRAVLNRGTGITYYGKVDKDDPTIIHYWASYIEDAGVLTERITFHRNDETSGNGKSFWNWSDGLMNCGGEYSFTATREEK